MTKYLRRGGSGAPPWAALVAFSRGMKVPEIAKALTRTERQVWRWKAWIRDHPEESAYALRTIPDYVLPDIQRSLGVSDI